MTPTQVKAVCEYLDAVADHMVHHVAEPHSRMIRYRAARDAMERAFGILPPLDLFADAPAPKSPSLSDLL